MNELPDEALEVIHIHVVSEETRPSINAVSYTTVLKRLVIARQSAVELVIITFFTLVKGYCCEDHVYNTLRVMDDMRSLESFAPDEIMCNSLFNALSGETERGRGSATFQRDASGLYCSLQLHAQHHGEALGLRAVLVPGLSVG